jgi:hypothetical protein
LDQRKQAGLAYLEKWDTKFWAETEERIKEITSKLEGQLTAELGIEEIASIKSKLNASEEIKQEHIHRAQKVVDKIQIRDLGEVIKLLLKICWSTERNTSSQSTD